MGQRPVQFLLVLHLVLHILVLVESELHRHLLLPCLLAVGDSFCLRFLVLCFFRAQSICFELDLLLHQDKLRRCFHAQLLESPLSVQCLLFVVAHLRFEQSSCNGLLVLKIFLVLSLLLFKLGSELGKALLGSLLLSDRFVELSLQQAVLSAVVVLLICRFVQKGLMLRLRLSELGLHIRDLLSRILPGFLVTDVALLKSQLVLLPNFIKSKLVLFLALFKFFSVLLVKILFLRQKGRLVRSQFVFDSEAQFSVLLLFLLHFLGLLIF